MGPIELRRKKLDSIRQKVNKGATFEQVKDELKALYMDVKSETDTLTQFLKEIRETTIEIKERKKEGVLLNPDVLIQRLRVTDVDLTTFIDKGWNSIAKGNYDEAIGILEKTKEMAPDNAKVLTLLGWAYVQKGRYDDALILYQKVLSIEPDNTMAMKDIGYLCYKKGIYGEAIEHLVRAIRLNSNPTATLYAFYYLGLVYLDREMLDDALEFFKKAAERGPNLQEAYFGMANVYEKTGDVELAKENFKKVIEINPETERAVKARKRLEEYID